MARFHGTNCRRVLPSNEASSNPLSAVLHLASDKTWTTTATSHDNRRLEGCLEAVTAPRETGLQGYPFVTNTVFV